MEASDPRRRWRLALLPKWLLHDAAARCLSRPESSSLEIPRGNKYTTDRHLAGR